MTACNYMQAVLFKAIKVAPQGNPSKILIETIFTFRFNINTMFDINTTNTVTLIIHKSPIAKWKNGTMVKWNIQNDDFIPADGKVRIEVQVVIGNKQYGNGKRMTLYLLPNLPVT